MKDKKCKQCRLLGYWCGCQPTVVHEDDDGTVYYSDGSKVPED